MADQRAGYMFHADPSWIEFHVENSAGGNVGYCRGAGAPMRNLSSDAKLFFMPRGQLPHRVAFCSDFVSADEIGVEAAWARYGSALGASNVEDWQRLISNLPSVRDKGRLIIVLGKNMRIPTEPVVLGNVGVADPQRAMKGWGINQDDVLRLLRVIERADERISSEPDLSEYEGSEEGRRKLRAHLVIERNPAVIKRAKQHWKQLDPDLRCCCCQGSFMETYGFEYVEAHHVVPLSELPDDGSVTTRIEDLVPVCSNCHRMLHRSEASTVDELRRTMKGRGPSAHRAFPFPME
jgi:hypothetical protein